MCLAGWRFQLLALALLAKGSLVKGDVKDRGLRKPWRTVASQGTVLDRPLRGLTC